MSRNSLPKVLCAIAISLALGLTTPLYAQRGGHGGGGGFHGGGGGFHGGGGGFHSGGGYGGYRGATGFRGVAHGPSFGGVRGTGFYGGRGYGWGSPGWGRGWGYPGWGGSWGYSGWGRGWGYPAFGWGGWGGWGVGISFNFGFGGVWGPGWYPYYAYNPWWWAPPAAPPCYYYPSPCYAPNGYVPAVPGSYSASSQDYPDNSSPDYSNADYSNPESSRYVGPSSQQLAESAIRQIPDARPEVRNAIRALSGMPPEARERELATGLYADFSREERTAVRNAVFTPAPNANSRTVMRTSLQAPEQHRREVRNAIRTLQAMPPAARQRQIESGVYSRFSPSEQLLLKNVSLSSQTRSASAPNSPQRGM